MDEETKAPAPDRPMNGWEALEKIFSNLAYCGLFGLIVWVIYLLAR